MSKRQSYQNRGFMRLLTMMYALGGNMWNTVFHNNRRNTGRAGGHLDTSYHSGGSHFGNTKKDQDTPQFKHKATIEKKRRRKEVEKSQRINRKRNARMCSFK